MKKKVTTNRPLMLFFIFCIILHKNRFPTRCSRGRQRCFTEMANSEYVYCSHLRRHDPIGRRSESNFVCTEPACLPGHRRIIEENNVSGIIRHRFTYINPADNRVQSKSCLPALSDADVIDEYDGTE